MVKNITTWYFLQKFQHINIWIGVKILLVCFFFTKIKLYTYIILYVYLEKKNTWNSQF